MLTPIEYYQHQVTSGVIQKDAQQHEVVRYLQNIYDQLLQKNKRCKGPLKFLYQKKVVRGLYVWGSVGVGKTFLMDCFCLCYPLSKIRMHFHVFLQHIHAELKKKQGLSLIHI